MQALLEIASFNEQSARLAAGAYRIALCVDYPNGGTTPPLETAAILVKEFLSRRCYRVCLNHSVMESHVRGTPAMVGFLVQLTQSWLNLGQ